MMWSKVVIYVVLTMTSNANGGWIDEETPADKRKITSLIDGTEYDLVRTVCNVDLIDRHCRTTPFLVKFKTVL